MQSFVRGAGVYARELTAAFKEIPGLEIVTTGTPDLVHYLYFDPFFLTLPPLRAVKSIVTVFDLTPIALPYLYPRGVRGELKWQTQKRLLRTADAVITISKSAKEDIIKFTGYPSDKIFVTYLAAGDQFHPLNLKRENIVLYVGDINPNKNVPTLLKAISELPKTKLVLVGKAFLEPTLQEAVKIREEIKTLGIGDRVEFTGYVSDEEKNELLNKAAVYCQPSVYEGFGLVVLEAMKCGTPVVCGKNSSLPEVAGTAAFYADVTNPGDLAEKISRAMKGDLKKQSLAQAAKFSWKKTAEETYEVYQKILAE